MLTAVSIHPEGGHDRVLVDLDPIDEDDQQVELAEIPAHELGKLLCGPRDEAA